MSPELVDRPVDLAPIAVGVDRLAQMVDIGRTTLWEEIAAGRLRARKIGRRTVVLIDDARAWLSAR